MGFGALLQEQLNKQPCPQGYRSSGCIQWKLATLSSQLSCMLKTIFPRGQIVVDEEAGVGRPTCDPGFAVAWVDTPENSSYVS